MQTLKTSRSLILVLLGIGPFSAFSQDALPISSLKLFYATGDVELLATDNSVRTITSDEINEQSLIINPGETLKTGQDGNVTLVADSRAAIQMEPNSKVMPPAQAEAPYSLSLLQGKLFLKVRPTQKVNLGDSEFRLKTPAMVLAVKGTSFFASAVAGNEIAGVNEGKIEAMRSIQGTTRSAPITGGNVLEIEDTGAARLRKLSAEEQAYQETYNTLDLAIDEASKSDSVVIAVRKWTDINGRIVDGILKSTDGTSIFLEVNGKNFELPINTLSAEDQAYIEAAKDSL